MFAMARVEMKMVELVFFSSIGKRKGKRKC